MMGRQDRDQRDASAWLDNERRSGAAAACSEPDGHVSKVPESDMAETDLIRSPRRPVQLAVLVAPAREPWQPLGL
jgi:hypothetical protein